MFVSTGNLRVDRPRRRFRNVALSVAVESARDGCSVRKQQDGMATSRTYGRGNITFYITGTLVPLRSSPGPGVPVGPPRRKVKERWCLGRRALSTTRLVRGVLRTLFFTIRGGGPGTCCAPPCAPARARPGPAAAGPAPRAPLHEYKLHDEPRSHSTGSQKPRRGGKKWTIKKVVLSSLNIGSLQEF